MLPDYILYFFKDKFKIQIQIQSFYSHEGQRQSIRNYSLKKKTDSDDEEFKRHAALPSIFNPRAVEIQAALKT